ncbi:tetratricopeptide repeat protein [Hwangdonia sp.]|uniref:tetratricopeptide repeat protein n=1 Tax=Hwangdonia sp. TaxID=1883432 RepID=UPI003AB3A603
MGFFFVPSTMFCQNQKDSLNIVNKINVLSFNYSQSINNSPLSSLNYAEEAFSYYNDIASTRLKFKVATNFATALYLNEDYNKALTVLDTIKSLKITKNDKALYYTLRGLNETNLNLPLQAESNYKKALKLYIELKDKNNEFTVLNNLGLLYNNIGDYKRSLEVYIECYAIINDLEIQVDRYKYYMNIGTVSHNLNDFANALDSYTNALQVAVEKQDTLRILKAYEKTALSHFEVNELDVAINNYKKSLKGYIKLGLKKDASNILISLGDIYYKKNKKEEALNYYNDAQDIALKNNFIQVDYQSSLRLAEYYLEQSNFDKAELYFQKIVKNLKTITNLELLSKAYHGLYQIEKQRKNTLLSLRYLENYLKYDNEIRKSQLITQNEQIEVQFNLKQKELELEKNELQLKNRQQQIQGLIIFAALIALLLILILTFYFQKRKAEKLLSSQNTKINAQNRELVLTNKEIKSRRKELLNLNKVKDQLLSIIAHDVKSPMTDLYNLLLILRHNLSSLNKDELKKNLAIVESSTGNLLNFLNNILNWTISQSSGIQVKINSFSLNELVKNNLKLVESAIVAKDLNVTFTPNKTLDVFTSDLNIVDFALRNILSNAVKFTHNQGSIHISLVKLSTSQIEIKVADSGIGFKEEIHTLLKENTERVPAGLGTNTEKGYGIGLSLCKKMLAKIDSQIIYEKNTPTGSVFSLRLTSMK